MLALSVTILLLLSATISASLELNGEYSLSNRAQSSSVSQKSGGLCSELVCSTTEMSLTIEVDKLKEMNVNIPNIHLEDPTCTGFTYNEKTVNIIWSLGSHVCGTKLTTNDTHIVYRNYVYLPPDPAAIIYREEFILNVSCTYPRYLNGSNDQILIPDISTTYIDIANNGRFQLKMAIYKDNSYTTPYTESPIIIPTKSNLYVGLYIVDGDISQAIKEFKLVMINCYSTPTNNIYDPIKYNIINNKCPNPSDSTIHVVENGFSTKGKFYIQMFKFIGNYDVIFLHCQVYLCESSCIPSCSSISSRSETPEPQATLTVGPIELSDSGLGTAAGFSMLTVLGVLLMNIFIV